MHTSQIISEAIQCIDSMSLDLSVKNMLLASFVSYFKSPLREQPWNTFPSKVKQGVLSIPTAINQLDEEKNADFWSNTRGKDRNNARNMVFKALVDFKNLFERKKVFKNDPSKELVAIPDLASPRSQPTLFPRDYLKQQITQGIMENELTGQPLSWALVQEIHTPTRTFSYPTSGRSLSGELIGTLIQKEIEQLKNYQEACIVCRKKSRQYKTLRDFQTIFFCSLKCMLAWNG